MKCDRTGFRRVIVFCTLVVAISVLVGCGEIAAQATLIAQTSLLSSRILSDNVSDGVAIPEASLASGSANEIGTASRGVDQSTDVTTENSFRVLVAQTVTHYSEITDETSIRDGFAQTLDVNEFDEAYEGTLALCTLDIEARYEMCSRQVDRRIMYEDLLDNDVSRIPETCDLSHQTDDARTGDFQMVRLVRSDITYEVTDTDPYGLPRSYRAICCYRGIEEYGTLVGYDVVATYQGTVQADMSKLTITHPQPIEPTDDLSKVSEGTVALPLAGMGTAVALGWSLLVFFWYRRHRNATNATNGSENREGTSSADSTARYR